MRQLLLMLPLLLTLLTSGCTTDFCIPVLMDCDQVVKQTHDVIVIESLQALPDNVPPDGSMKVVAIVSNVADIDAEITNVPVTVELYDYCEGLFSIISSSGGNEEECTPQGNDEEKNDCGSRKADLLRNEKAQIEWTLKAMDRDHVPVVTDCTLKIRAIYPYATRSVTTLHMIDYAEMQRRINEGTYKEIGSYHSIGYGPIKPYIWVEGTQPIPVSATGGDTEDSNKINTVLSLQVMNEGNGFLSSNPKGGEPRLSENQFQVKAITQDLKTIQDELIKCIDNFDDSDKGEIKLINKKSTKVPCPLVDVFAGKVPVESTKTIQASIGLEEDGSFKPDGDSAYWYEFRKEIKVTVEPTF